MILLQFVLYEMVRRYNTAGLIVVKIYQVPDTSYPTTGYDIR